MFIPQYSATGDSIPPQFKPHRPVVGPQGKPCKYVSATGHSSRIDVHPANAERIHDVGVPLWITEGVKKADALTSAGACVVALTGVFNWRTKLRTLGDWEDVPLRDREVIICFDADAHSNVQVARAMERLGRWLKSKGAK